MDQQRRPVQRALISVSDKRGIEALGRALAAAGAEILSTGGSAARLREAGVPVTDVSAHTGFPEIMGGRVKTLHPRIHGGILARRGVDDEVLARHDIQPIDLVVVNLYPFADTVARPGCTEAEALEQIDIGGPAMLRAAAKNHAWVGVVVSPDDYPELQRELETGGLTARLRRRLAARAFAHTAAYDSAIAAYLGEVREEVFPATLVECLERVSVLRYGENPHQRAALYRERGAPEDSLAAATPLQGKALSYNNLADADAALACVADLSGPACVIVKHANPCGACVAEDLAAAYEGAYACDPTSAFGGIIAFNGEVDADLARTIIDRQFVEVLCAPGFSAEALEHLRAKPSLRVLRASGYAAPPRPRLRSIDGGLLAQDDDHLAAEPDGLRVVSRRQPGEAELADLLFAWRVVKHVRSNAIVLACDRRTVGIGAGQMSRVMSVRIAGMKLAEIDRPAAAPVLASDAFFPFRDGIDAAAELGVGAVIQPGGSKRDEEIVAAADERDLAMVFTGRRHFRH